MKDMLIGINTFVLLLVLGFVEGKYLEAVIGFGLLSLIGSLKSDLR